MDLLIFKNLALISCRFSLLAAPEEHPIALPPFPSKKMRPQSQSSIEDFPVLLTPLRGFFLPSSLFLLLAPEEHPIALPPFPSKKMCPQSQSSIEDFPVLLTPLRGFFSFFFPLPSSFFLLPTALPCCLQRQGLLRGSG